MWLKQKQQNYRDLIRLGWLCLLFGLFASVLTQERFLAGALHSLIADERLLDTLHGITDGLSGVALGMSVVLNVRGLMLYRQQE